MSYAGEATAEVTGLVFQHGAIVIGSNHAETMYHLGYAFGEMVYTLDALEDYEKDVRAGEFNPIRHIFGLTGPSTLPEKIESLIRERLHQIADHVEDRLRELPMDRDLTLQFVHRLQSNLSKRLGEVPTITRTPFQRFAQAMTNLLPLAQLRPVLTDGLAHEVRGTMTPGQSKSVTVVRRRGGNGCCSGGGGFYMPSCSDMACCCCAQEAGECACSACCEAASCCAAG